MTRGCSNKRESCRQRRNGGPGWLCICVVFKTKTREGGIRKGCGLPQIFYYSFYFYFTYF